MNITFIGAGYVGLVSGTMFAHLGHKVTCLDTDERKIVELQNGKLPIYEPELELYVKQSMASGNLTFTTDYGSAIKDSQIIFIAVGTPPLDSGGADLHYVFEAVDSILKVTGPDDDKLIVIKSTVPPGTCLKVAEYIRSKGKKFKIASNPEFLREGSAVWDFLNPDRIVIGTTNISSNQLLEEIYAPLIKQGLQLFSTDITTSELIKYSSNSFLATKIAFINEMADLCEQIGANIEDLALGVGLDKRIGKEFLKAGPGFGGSCFPKDILALSHITKQNNCAFHILNATIKANQERPMKMAGKVSAAIGGIQGKKIAVLGLSFKAGTDDVRSSPAIEICQILQQQGAEICAFDPVAMDNARVILPDISYAPSILEASKDARAIIILTEWPEFTQLPFAELALIMKSRIILDFRNILNEELAVNAGFEYYSIGKKHE